VCPGKKSNIFYKTRTIPIKFVHRFLNKFAAKLCKRFHLTWLMSLYYLVQNMHHWSGRTEIANENGVGQAGSCCHCGSHSPVASLIAADQCTLSDPRGQSGHGPIMLLGRGLPQAAEGIVKGRWIMEISRLFTLASLAIILKIQYRRIFKVF